MYKYDQVYSESLKYFNNDELAAKVFVDKYALQNKNGEYLELTPRDMHKRMAKEFARIEAKYENGMSEDEIFNLLDKFKYIVPQGSPMFGIGNNIYVQSLGNCFVVNPPYDSYGGILTTDQELAQLMKRRCGVGVDISTIRPKGMVTNNAAKTTDGIGIFMERFSNTTREVAQCLRGDTLVLTLNGLKPISQVNPNDKVWTAKKWVNVLKVLKNKKSLVKVKTKHGKELFASKDHVLHCVDSEKQIKDIHVGSKVSQIIGNGWEGSEINLKTIDYSGKKDISQPTTLTIELAYVLGQMYGDGCVYKDSISVCTSNEWSEIKDKLINNIQVVFNTSPTIKTKENDNSTDVVIHSKEVIKFLEHNNLLKQKSKDIVFPESLLSAKKEVLFSFISGFFDADGNVSVKKKYYRVASINEKFLQTMQNVLSAFGVISTIHRQQRKGKWSDLYTLSINGKKNQSIFKEYLNESIKIKNLALVNKRRDFSKSIYTVKDFGSIASRHFYIAGNENKLSYSTLSRLKEELGSDKDTFLFLDKVTSIEEVSGEEDVYDLVLESEHLFFGNGLYVHNSGRRGALMLSIDIRHPEIETFINIKKDLRKVTGANISVRITDDFMRAVKSNSKFTLHYPTDKPISEALVTKEVNAKEIWDQIIKCAWLSAEPGILFWDSIVNNSPADCYAVKNPNFKTTSTNPCGEIPLGLDSCRLLVTNLSTFVKNPFTKDAYFDFKLFGEVVQKAQRLMDDLIDLEIEKTNKILRKLEEDPEPQEIKQIEINMWTKFLDSCVNGRRTGNGITALGDCLAMLGIVYGSDESVKMTGEIYKTLALNAYKSTCILAKERGTFPLFERELEENNPYISLLLSEDKELKDLYYAYGRRNIALLTTAPTGSVSTLTQTTSGIEPAYLLSYKRRKKINPSMENERVDFVDALGDRWQEFDVYHHKVKEWMDITGEKDLTKSPYYGGTSNDVNWLKSVEIQAIAQKYIDHSISKTCVTKDSLIETNNGLMYLDEIFNIDKMNSMDSLENNKNILLKNHDGNYVSPSHFHNMGEKKIVKVTLENGLSLKVTTKEQFYVFDEKENTYKWKYIEDINTGDKLKIS